MSSCEKMIFIHITNKSSGVHAVAFMIINLCQAVRLFIRVGILL